MKKATNTNNKRKSSNGGNKSKSSNGGNSQGGRVSPTMGDKA